ncbi:hypothetical protein ABZ897_00370 [Nonomuraea sp. NPDC046802]|uniref:hypothetical protein n=1 Tax=Nonomuraea sp. NPDC046802 TaxID=3154919 RepID=UPI0033E9C45A
MKPLERVFTLPQTVEWFGGKEVVTEYWLKKTARKLKIGTRLGRRLVFTETQLQMLLDAHALQGQEPKPARKTGTVKKPRPAKPQNVPAANSAVTPLCARPERARSYRGTA